MYMFVYMAVFMAGAVVELRDVWKVYRVGKRSYPALRGLSLSVEEGEFVAIVGPSGSGKSTLLNLIGALDRPSRGSVLINGVDISRLSDNQMAELRNRVIGFVFQSFNLISHLTALENVMVPMIPAGIPRSERKKRARMLLERFLPPEIADKKPLELSGGEQQRVAIARALANDPRIILADEPTGNLDSKSAERVMDVFRELHGEGRTIIMVTHNLEITRYCDRVVRIQDGRIAGYDVRGGGRAS